MIVLDHRVTEQTSTRRLRILKYRGSLHGTNEYPFLIGESGRLGPADHLARACSHGVSTERVSTGVARLDAMLGDGGFYKGSTVLVSGTAGTGKSTLAAQFCDAACAPRRAGASTSPSRSPRRRSSATWPRSASTCGAGSTPACCSSAASGPSLLGLEAHLFAMQKLVGEFDPAVVVMDPVSDLLRVGTGADVSRDAHPPGRLPEGQGRDRAVHQPQRRRRPDARPTSRSRRSSTPGCSSRRMEGNGEHNRVLYVLKSRGMAHSNQIREFLLTDQGIELADVYVGPQGVLTGSARQAQEAKERSDGDGAARGPRAAPGQPRAPARVGRGADRGAVARVRGRGRRRRAACSATARPASRTAPASAPSRAGCAGPTPTSRRAPTDADGSAAHDDRAPTTRPSPRRADEVWYLRLYVAGQSPKSLRAFANLQDALRGAPGRALRDRDHRPGRAPGAGARATTSSPSRRSSAASPRRCARSSATSPTPSACSSASGSTGSASDARRRRCAFERRSRAEPTATS